MPSTPAVAEEIAAMQFLDRLEPSDLVALNSLSRLADDDYEVFLRVMAHRNIRDGIFDQEAEIVALLSGVNRINPDLLATLLGSPPDLPGAAHDQPAPRRPG